MTNFDPNMRRKFFSPKIEAGDVLIMFLFLGGFQPGCSYKRCSYRKKKGVYETMTNTERQWLNMSPLKHFCGLPDVSCLT